MPELPYLAIAPKMSKRSVSPSMRVFLALVLCMPAVALAGDFSWPWSKQPACGPQPSCDFPGYQPCGPKEGPPVPKEGPPAPKEGPPPEEQVELEETGVFVAPPRTGATRGAINRTGIEGMSITFPQLRLSMPSIELPCRYHGRSEARMMIDAAEAPYVRTGYQAKRILSQVAAPATTKEAPQEKEAAPKAPTPMDCETQLKQLEEKYAELQKELENCMQQQKSLKGGIEQGKGFPPKGMTPQQGPPVQQYEGSSRRQQVLVSPASYQREHFSLEPMYQAGANYRPDNSGYQRLPPPPMELHEGAWTPRRP